MVPEAGPIPRRARQLVPAQFPRRAELIAVCAVVILLAHLLLAQLTLVLAVLFAVAGKITRWRRSWLLAPALAGLAWILAAGPAEALAGFAAGPSSVLGHLAGGTVTGHAARPLTAFAGIGRWLPRQLPVALPLAAAEAALAGWLAWLHTDEWLVPPPRPGAVAALRTAFCTRRIRSGAVLTRDGVALGVAPSTGAVAELTWQEISRGVLVAGADARQVTLTCLQFVHAAVRRRKPVVVLDDGHDAGIARALAAACEATGTPLRRDGGSLGGSQLWGRASRTDLHLDLELVVGERSAALVPVESPESAARAAGRLAALGAALRALGVDGDGLVWVPAAERLPAGDLATLISDGAAAGLPVLAGAVSPSTAGELAGHVGALLVHRVADRSLADGLAAATGTRLLPAPVAAARAGQPLPESTERQAALAPCPVVEAHALLALRPAEFVLVASTPRRRVIAQCRLVPARLPRHEGKRRRP
jgi:hypothetical protein